MSFVLWITGLPCSGKTTLSKNIKSRLNNQNMTIVTLDGDDMRETISSDLDYSYMSRKENVRRVAYIAKLLSAQGISSIVSILSPLEKHRTEAAKIIGEKFHLIYLDTSLSVCEKRDVKGMYKKARENKIKDFTGINSKFEKPSTYNLKINTSNDSIGESTDVIIQYMEKESLIRQNEFNNKKYFQKIKK